MYFDEQLSYTKLKINIASANMRLDTPRRDMNEDDCVYSEWINDTGIDLTLLSDTKYGNVTKRRRCRSRSLKRISGQLEEYVGLPTLGNNKNRTEICDLETTNSDASDPREDGAANIRVNVQFNDSPRLEIKGHVTKCLTNGETNYTQSCDSNVQSKNNGNSQSNQCKCSTKDALNRQSNHDVINDNTRRHKANQATSQPCKNRLQSSTSHSGRWVVYHVYLTLLFMLYTSRAVRYVS